MGWLWGSSLSAEEKASLRRRCASAVAAHRNCVAANGAAAAEACRNLEVSVLDCKATVVCPEAAAEHGRCLHSLVETGKYQASRPTPPTPTPAAHELRHQPPTPTSLSLTHTHTSPSHPRSLADAPAGRFAQGKRDCDAAIAAMRKCLRRKGVDLRA